MSAASIKPHDVLRFVDDDGQAHKGRAVMPASCGGGAWVVNCGGPHGTPAVVFPWQIITHSTKRRHRDDGARNTARA